MSKTHILQNTCNETVTFAENNFNANVSSCLTEANVIIYDV